MLRYGSPGVLLLLLTSSSAPLWAQGSNIPGPAVDRSQRDSVHMAEPLGGDQVRQGAWFGGGLGFGTTSCGPGSGSIAGVTAAVEAGWTFSRRFLLGIGTNAWTRDFGRLGMTVGSVDLRARWYPSELAGGLFLTGALGLGFIRFSDELADPQSYTATGRAFRAGLGYDFRVARGGEPDTIRHRLQGQYQ